jgi:DNA-binding response OmpR family regulator
MSRPALIVDDEQPARTLLASLVERRGYSSIQLDRGAGVVEAVKTHHPEFVLLDVLLPDADGFAIIERLKLTRETNLTPVVIVTALNGAAHQFQGIRVGANRYITKPFEPHSLYEAIEEVVAWRKEHADRGITGEIQFKLRSEFRFLQQLNDMLADLYAHTPLTEKQIKDLRQAVHEMGGNAIEWGHGKNADLPLTVTYRIHSNRVALIIRDQGPGFDPANIPHAACEEDPVKHLEIRLEKHMREGGFGIMLAKGLVDDFHYNDPGNEVTLVKYFEPAPSQKP